MVSVKYAKKAPARATIVGRMVGPDELGGPGLDKRQLARLGFKAEAAQTATMPGRAGAVRVLVGLGPRNARTPDVIRRAGAAFAKAVADQRSATIELGRSLVATDPVAAAQALTEGVMLGGYRFDDLRSSPGTHLGSVTVVGSGTAARAEGEAEGVRRGRIIGEAACWARDRVNEPGGTLTPRVFAEKISERATAAGLAVEVLDKRGITAEGMRGVLAVNQGSSEEPRFVKLTYAPEGASASLGYVGKGITFDSGGLSIKTAEGMMSMKSDMGGAAAVTAAACAVAELGLPVAVTTYTPLTDNMTGGAAQRPGDVYTSRSGTTVEVMNTDAEGRLVLGDALSLAAEAGHDAIVDLATLTGACMVALGDKIAGVMGTADDFVEEIRAAAATAGERVWPLPLPEDYRKQLDSTVADVKNVGSRYGGALTAGLFLKEFVPARQTWAHMDIAGPAWCDDLHNPETPKGGTGFGVRTLVALAEARTRPADGA